MIRMAPAHGSPASYRFPIAMPHQNLHRYLCPGDQAEGDPMTAVAVLDELSLGSDVHPDRLVGDDEAVPLDAVDEPVCLLATPLHVLDGAAFVPGRLALANVLLDHFDKSGIAPVRAAVVACLEGLVQQPPIRSIRAHLAAPSPTENQADRALATEPTGMKRCGPIAVFRAEWLLEEGDGTRIDEDLPKRIADSDALGVRELAKPQAGTPDEMLELQILWSPR